MSGPADVPAEILDRLRPVCLRFPQTYEEPAWMGTRWRIRTRTFAHVFTLDPDDDLLIARAAEGGGESSCGLTFRSPVGEIDALVSGGHPFFKPSWAPNVVGIVLDDETDWSEVRELLTESYCLLAPKKLAAQVDRPSSGTGLR